MRHLAIATLLLPACFEEAPPVEDDQLATTTTIPTDAESGDSGDESDQIDHEPYAPCVEDSDCPIIPGDDGSMSDGSRCLQGTCSYRCVGDNGHDDNSLCPGSTVALDGLGGSLAICNAWCTVDKIQPQPSCEEKCAPIAETGYCYETCQASRDCPDGMIDGDLDVATPGDLMICVWAS